MRGHLPIVCYGWRDAVKAVAEGEARLLVYSDGHAEVIDLRKGHEGAMGYLTKRSLTLYREHTKPRAGGREGSRENRG